MHPCPECRAVADLSGIALPPAGRLVSCGICGGIWRAFPLPSPAAASEPVAAEPPAPRPAEVAPPAPERAKKSSPRAGGRLVWGRRLVIGIAASLTVAGGLAAARDYLAVWVPSSRGVFAAMGMPARPSEVAVELVGIAPVDGGAAFRVTYEIVNDTALRRPLPTVCATGRSSEAERLFLRCFPGDAKGISSRATQRFTFIAADLPAPLADLDLDLSLK